MPVVKSWRTDRIGKIRFSKLPDDVAQCFAPIIDKAKDSEEEWVITIFSFEVGPDFVNWSIAVESPCAAERRCERAAHSGTDQGMELIDDRC